MEICRRVFEVEGHGELIARVFQPVVSKAAWRCRYEVAWEMETVGREMVGEDSLQALQFALGILKVELERIGSRYRVTFVGSSDLWL